MNNHPLLHNYQSRLIFAGIGILIACIQAVVLYGYSDLYWTDIVWDSVIFTLTLIGCVIGLWYPIRFNRTVLNGWLFVAFHVLLSIIFLFCWLGVGFLLISCLATQNLDYHFFFLSTLLIRIVMGVLIYALSVLTYSLLILSSELKKKTETELSLNNEILTRVAVKRRQEIQVIPVNEITHLIADGDYVHLHTKDERFLKEKTMKYWETHLPAHLFVRIHRSSIVNVEFIAKIEIYEKESYRVHLKNGSFLKASSLGYKLLKQKISL